jgi:hypothetical protein
MPTRRKKKNCRMDSFHTSCGSWTWEKNTRERERERERETWSKTGHKSPKFKAMGHPKKQKKEKKSVHKKDIWSLEKLC